MKAADIIKTFDKTSCPVAAINAELEIIAANKSALEIFAPIFTENGFKEALLTEEIIEINAKIRQDKNITIHPQRGIFKGAVLQIVPSNADDEDFTALIFITNTGKNIIENAPQTEMNFMSKYFEPKMREAVTSIFANADLIKNSQATVLTDNAEESLENIIRESYGVLRLADHVRIIASLETEELNVTTCDIVGFIVDLMESVKIMTHGYEFDVEIRKEIERGKTKCSFDKAALTRAILCLVSNACKASGKGSIIKVNITATETDLRFSITNGGAHIPSQVIPYVFEPYFSYQAYEEEQRSTGLGLTIVKAVAERHGGNVLLQSSVQYGTTVMLRIPMRHLKSAPNQVGQTMRDYLTDRFSPVFIELYGI